MCIVCYVIPVALHLKIYMSPGGYGPRPQCAGAEDSLSAHLLQARSRI